MTQPEAIIQQDVDAAVCYAPPLHYTESDRLRARQYKSGSKIVQVMSPLLCDTSEVQVSDHVLGEMPISMGLSSDAEADIFCIPELLARRLRT